MMIFLSKIIQTCIIFELNRVYIVHKYNMAPMEYKEKHDTNFYRSDMDVRRLVDWYLS